MKLRYIVEIDIDEGLYNENHKAGSARDFFRDELQSNLESLSAGDGITHVRVQEAASRGSEL